MSGFPTVHDVALRALCLTAVAAAGAYATVLVAEPEAFDEVAEALAELTEWLHEDDVIAGFSPDEQQLLAHPIEEWTDEQRIAAASRAESLGVLLWALQIVDVIPPWDEPFDTVEEAPLGENVEELLERANLRPLDEIERARDIADLWQWRAAASSQDIDILGGTARAAYEAGDILAPIDGDFPMFEKAYRDLADDESALARTIAAERRQALAWLCGQIGSWESPAAIVG